MAHLSVVVNATALVTLLALFAGNDPHRSGCAGADPAATTPVDHHDAAPIDSLAARANPWSEKVRSLLVTPCGSCHRSTLTTAVPRALLVYDLDKPLWHRTLTVEQARELGRRAEKLKEIDEFDRDVVRRFVACRTGGDCSLPEQH